jgi:hypothetical protein
MRYGVRHSDDARFTMRAYSVSYSPCWMGFVIIGFGVHEGVGITYYL